MSGDRPDRRIAKTRHALADALMILIERKDWGDITIQAICGEANVARASFYAHFDSKIGLLEWMLNRNLGDLATRIASLGGGGLDVLAWFVDHVTSSRSRFTRIVLSPEAHPALARFMAVVAEQLAESLRREGTAADIAQVHFIMGGTMELLTAWSKTWRPQEVLKLREDVLACASGVLGGRLAARESFPGSREYGP